MGAGMGLLTPQMIEQMEKDKELWVPPGLERLDPIDSREPEPFDAAIQFNAVDMDLLNPGEMAAEVRAAGIVRVEPEIARAKELGIEVAKPEDIERMEEEGLRAGYSDTYWTHFNWRSDVAKLVARIQKKFPYRTYANTYFCHPPVYPCRTTEYRSVDFWGGGIVNGRYAGYRGKPLGWTVNGTTVMNAIFNDPHLPNIAWIIWNGRMWTRGYGWGPAPGGPADSDPGHYSHIHVTYV